MTTSQDKPENIQPSQLPNGMDEKDYAGYKKWSNGRWAWEFLRRNVEYQILCKRVQTSDMTKKELNKLVKNDYGLFEYKDYKEAFEGEGITRPRFNTRNIQSWSFITDNEINGKKNKISLMRQPGTVIIRFNINGALKSKNAIKKQLNIAKILLMNREKKFLELNQSSVKTKRISSTDFIELIRLLDVIEYNKLLPNSQKMKQAQLYAIIFPKLVKNMDREDGVIKRQFGKAFSEKRKQAQRYAKFKYLAVAAKKNRMKTR